VASFLYETIQFLLLWLPAYFLVIKFCLPHFTFNFSFLRLFFPSILVNWLNDIYNLWIWKCYQCAFHHFFLLACWFCYFVEEKYFLFNLRFCIFLLGSFVNYVTLNKITFSTPPPFPPCHKFSVEKKILLFGLSQISSLLPKSWRNLRMTPYLSNSGSNSTPVSVNWFFICYFQYI